MLFHLATQKSKLHRRMQIFWLNVPYVLKQNLWGKWHKCTHNWKFYVSIVLFAQLTCWCALMKSSNKRTQLFWVHCWCACVSVVCFSFYLYSYIYEWRYKEYFNRNACKIVNTCNVYSACLYSTISRGRRTIVASIHDVPLFFLCDARWYFHVRSKADIRHLNPPHGTNN